MKKLLTKILRPFTAWRDLWIEIRTWVIFRRVAKEYEKTLNDEHSLRVDWLGRIYGVINLPEEVIGAATQVQEAYVLQEVTNYGKVMMKIGLADVVYPEMSRIEGSAAFLVVMWPEYRVLSFWKIMGLIFSSAFYATIIYMLIRVIIKHHQYLIEFFKLTADSIKSII